MAKTPDPILLYMAKTPDPMQLFIVAGGIPAGRSVRVELARCIARDFTAMHQPGRRRLLDMARASMRHSLRSGEEVSR